ncbi:hypothetical protein J2S05_001283 [Alkalicoccobacillus murimartini]|uniref:Uncharacterized protein n=2 Tax=Alkalicoccobacillus murimartini TaxID=171685 RepID=A0ABT9YF85_9BACI|nr:hypothetical protein [Alkalicoccobacillus murimartini]
MTHRCSALLYNKAEEAVAAPESQGGFRGYPNLGSSYRSRKWGHAYRGKALNEPGKPVHFNTPFYPAGVGPPFSSAGLFVGERISVAGRD